MLGRRGNFGNQIRRKGPDSAVCLAPARWQRKRDVFEMTWADDGRALFKYGASPHEGDNHIIWLRIGSHEILDD